MQAPRAAERAEGAPKGTLDPRRGEMALHVLQEVLRCAYDPEAWRSEMETLERRCASAEPEAVLAAIDRVDAVLGERVELFNRLRERMPHLKQKVAAAQTS